MKLLYRYILLQFVKYIFMIMAYFIAIYVLIDFFEKIDSFMEKGKSMFLVMKFFLLNIPFIIELMGPVCILLAGVVTLGILNRSNELIALKACGVPLNKIVGPILLAGLAFSLLFLAMSQFILPKTAAITNRIWNVEVKGRVPLGIYRNGRYYYRGDKGFYSFARPDPHKNVFLHFSYSSWGKNYQLDSLVAAKKAVWRNGTWTLYQGQVQTGRGQGHYATKIFSKRNFGFTKRPADFFVPEYRSLELSLVGLFLNAKHQRSKEEANRAWAEFYGRIAYILLGPPLLLLGLPLLLIVYRRWGRDLSLAIPVSCGLAFFCWGIWATMQSLAKANYLNPLLAATTVHLLIGVTGLYLLLREDT
ncbi:Lipopolysaccharide export system permease protein LptG [hydrothermal vent metagenome]|uniref:Lipopolysaccharide export system permease protein LptG n=1 Tax=hydrothermal vent metagenome TaxID=652676 RepID=A0A3B0VQT3_9ZZZZ